MNELQLLCNRIPHQDHPLKPDKSIFRGESVQMSSLCRIQWKAQQKHGDSSADVETGVINCLVRLAAQWNSTARRCFQLEYVFIRNCTHLIFYKTYWCAPLIVYSQSTKPWETETEGFQIASGQEHIINRQNHIVCEIRPNNFTLQT